jgi:5-dehydro-2-deoxygluconokinase
MSQQADMSPTFDLISLGRVGVDLYPDATGVPLRLIDTFHKFLGGSPTNVAVAAARYGRRSAVITRTGADPMGEFVHDALRSFGVDDRFVTSVAGLPTPIVFCELFPPDDFPLYFYRYPVAPDTVIRPEELDLVAIAATKVFWMTGTGLASHPVREATFAALRHRHQHADADAITIFDLDWRPELWPDVSEAEATYAEALELTTVAVGNRGEVKAAVGLDDPDAAAEALLARGLRLAIVKQGPAGTMANDGHDRVVVPPVPIEVVNGLGAGDAFGGALVHGLLAGWPLHEVITVASAAGAYVAGQLACSSAMPDARQVADLLNQAGVQVPDGLAAGAAAVRGGGDSG